VNTRRNTKTTIQFFIIDVLAKQLRRQIARTKGAQKHKHTNKNEQEETHGRELTSRHV
jgi:hypothetical protein